MSSTKYALEHFYYTQSKEVSRLLAKSSGVPDDLVNAAVKQVPLPPLPGFASWAITRGKQIPALLVQSQSTGAGQSVLHFVVMPPEVLRAIGGNLHTLSVVLEPQMPVFAEFSDTLPLLELPDSGPSTSDTQIDNILDLMTFTKNKMQTMERVLGAIVQGVQLVITNAPADVSQRIKFVEGLLALLPSSARHGVTFATHSEADSALDVQIRFVTGETASPETLIYDWKTANASGKEFEDDYSHFIISQLRLDADLVIQQTQSMTAVAGWRVRDMGDRLRDALAYASHRRKIDESLLNGQPVEIVDVSQILAEDPTLTPELRVAYSRHVVNFSLALGEMQHADPVAVMLNNNPDLSRTTLQQMNDALKEGKAGVIYDTLLRWMSNPLGPQEPEWVTLVHNAALSYLQTLIDESDFEGIHEFLLGVEEASPAVAMVRIVPKIVEKLMPLALHDSGLAEKLFVVSSLYMETDFLKKLLATASYVAQLPKQVGALLPYLAGKDTKTLPAGVLNNVARVFGDEWQPVVVVRLTELALQQERASLIDTEVLKGLLKAAFSPFGLDHRKVLLDVTRSFNTGGLLALEPPGPRILLQILLALGEYRDLAREMIRHSRELYPGDLQIKYIAMVERMFAETPLSPEQALRAVQTLSDEGIKGVPLLVASAGALESAAWSPLMQPVAENVINTLFENPNFLEVFNLDATIALLTYYVKQKDVPNTVRAAGLVPTVAAQHEASGLAAISETYKLMTWDEPVRLVALELLRQYVRKADDKDARQAVGYFGRELGAEVRRSLEVTYYIKRFMSGYSIEKYTVAAHRVGEFLQDLAGAYADKNTVPSVQGLVSMLEERFKTASREDRRAVGEHLLAAGKAIAALGKQYRANSPRNVSGHIDALLAGKTDPLSAVDVFRVLGGFLTKGKRANITIKPASDPLGKRYIDAVTEDAILLNRVLSGAANAFPADKPFKLTAREALDEMDSIWGELSEAQQNHLLRALAVELQRIPELVVNIAENGDAKTLEEGSLAQKIDTGKQRPRSTLEMLRFVYGYFKAGQ